MLVCEYIAFSLTFCLPFLFWQAVKAQLAEAQKIASGSGSEQDIAEAKIELEVSVNLFSLISAFYTINFTPLDECGWGVQG